MPRRGLFGCWDTVNINDCDWSDSESDDELYIPDIKDPITAIFDIQKIYDNLINFTKESGVILLDELSLFEWIEWIAPELNQNN